MAIDTGILRREIEETKLILEEKYAIAHVAARKAAESYKALLIAEENRDLKNGSKEIAKHEVAEDSFKLSLREYFYFSDTYTSLVEKLLALYEDLIESGCAGVAKKARAEAKRFEEKESYRKDKLSDIVMKISGIDDAYAAYVSESEIKEVLPEKESELQEIKKAPDFQALESKAAEEYALYNEPRNTYAAEAINVDITNIIESAVAKAMDRFNTVLEMRTNKIIDNGESSEDEQPQASPVSEDIFKMHSELVDFELEIAAKLAVLTEKLKNISEDLINIGATCINLAGAQREVAESQKKTEEMQNTLLQDAKKTEEGQKIISEAQSALMERQTALSELQRTNAEKQAFLTKEQSEISELQKATYAEHKRLKKKIKK